MMFMGGSYLASYFGMGTLTAIPVGHLHLEDLSEYAYLVWDDSTYTYRVEDV